MNDLGQVLERATGRLSVVWMRALIPTSYSVTHWREYEVPVARDIDPCHPLCHRRLGGAAIRPPHAGPPQPPIPRPGEREVPLEGEQLAARRAAKARAVRRPARAG